MRYIPHLLSHYFWVLILLCIFVPLGFCYKIKHSIGPITSQKAEKWNSSKIPYVFVHISDTHFNSKAKENEDNFRSAIKTSYQYKPDLLLHTGDGVDDYTRRNDPKIAKQIEEDHIKYQKLIKEHIGNFTNVIGVAGNHDVFDLAEFDNEINFWKYFPYQNQHSGSYEDLLVSKFETNDFIFVLLNPFKFPVCTASLAFWYRYSTMFLDKLENVINSTNLNKKILLASHLPINCYLGNVKSTSHRSLEEILNHKNILGFFSGHMHPEQTLFEYHNSYIDYIATDMKTKRIYGLVTIDNNRIFYHEIYSDTPPKAILTYPIPLNQTSSSSCFDDDDATIRILSYGPKELSIKITGDLVGDIKNIKKLNDSLFLYEYPLKGLSNGKHHLKFTGDWNYEIVFQYGGTIPKFKNEVYNLRNLIKLVKALTIILWIYLALITFPIDCFMEDTNKEFIDWINNYSSTSFWCFSLTGFGLRAKLMEVPLFQRISLFILVIWNLFLPYNFSKCDGKVGVLWTYGSIIQGKQIFDDHSLTYVLFYLGFVVIPATLAFGSIGIRSNNIIYTIVEVSILIITSIILITQYIYFDLTQVTGFGFQFIGITYIGGLYSYILIIYTLIKFIKERDESSSLLMN